MLLRTQCFSLYLGHAPRSTPEELSNSKRELKQKRIYITCIYAQKMHCKCHLIWYLRVLLSNKRMGNSKNDKNLVLMMSRQLNAKLSTWTTCTGMKQEIYRITATEQDIFW